MAIMTSMNGQRQAPAVQTADSAADSGAPAAAMIPFVRGALWAIERGTPILSTLGAGAVNQTHILPMVNGWDRFVVLEVVVATTGNSATVALGPDAPYALLSQVIKQDNRQQLLYQLRGYDGFLADRMGGYHLFDPAGDTGTFVALTTGAGATAPTGTFYFYVPDEFGREGWGCWPNMDSSQRRSITVSLSALTNVQLFSTPPNGTTTVTVTPVMYYYARPPSIDANGQAIADRPDMAGTISYWREQTEVISSGDNTLTIRMTGREIRNAFVIFTTAADVRSNTVRPTTMRLELDNGKVFDCAWADHSTYLYSRSGQLLQTGVFPLNIGTLAPDGIPVNEYPDGYWSTSSGSQMRVKFSAGAAGKAYFVFNEVVFSMPLPSNL